MRTLDQLNGREPVWQLALGHLSGWADWFFGIGYAAIRVVIYPQFSYAGEAHNAWVELIVDIGIPGCAAMVLTFLFAGFRLVRWRIRGGGDLVAFAGASLALLLVVSVASEAFVLPGMMFALLVLACWLARMPGGEPAGAESGAVPGVR